MRNLCLSATLTLIVSSVTWATTSYIRLRTLGAPFAVKPASLSVIDTGDVLPIEPHERLDIVSNGKSHIVQSLSDLRGCVGTDNEDDAISFVRLRTSPSTWFMWPGPKIVEIVDKAHFRTLPNYGLEDYRAFADFSGGLGCLSNDQFRRGGFSLATERSAGNAFIVERWLYCKFDNRDEVWHVRETVGRDGSYLLRVLEKRPTPKLPNTDWQLPLFE